MRRNKLLLVVKKINGRQSAQLATNNDSIKKNINEINEQINNASFKCLISNNQTRTGFSNEMGQEGGC